MHNLLQAFSRELSGRNVMRDIEQSTITNNQYRFDNFPGQFKNKLNVANHDL